MERDANAKLLQMTLLGDMNNCLEESDTPIWMMTPTSMQCTTTVLIRTGEGCIVCAAASPASDHAV